jgi:hypothetical protein
MCITRMTIHVRVASLALVIASTLSSCAEAPDAEESARKRCIALREHLIGIRLATASESVDVTAHRKAFENALGERFVDDCRELPAKQVECSLRAVDSEAVSSCVLSPQ